MNVRNTITMGPATAPPDRRRWLKRIGRVGFLFFLLKGLVWLAVFLGVGSLWAC